MSSPKIRKQVIVNLIEHDGFVYMEEIVNISSDDELEENVTRKGENSAISEETSYSLDNKLKENSISKDQGLEAFEHIPEEISYQSGHKLEENVTTKEKNSETFQQVPEAGYTLFYDLDENVTLNEEISGTSVKKSLGNKLEENDNTQPTLGIVKLKAIQDTPKKIETLPKQRNRVPGNCRMCGKRFNRKDAATRHEREHCSHHGGPRHTCDRKCPKFKPSVADIQAANPQTMFIITFDQPVTKSG